MSSAESRWTPATFEIAMGEPGACGPNDTVHHRETVEGETWGAFGINAEDDGPFGPSWFVTHLPTGYKLVEARSRGDARRFCETIQPLTDWALIRPGHLHPGLRDDCLRAWGRARGAMVIDADEREPRPADERQDDIVWPPPAKHEVEKAGTPLLPGMDEVPERPEEGRRSWTG